MHFRLFLLPAAFFCAPCAAQDKAAPKIIDDVTRCLEIKEPDARLACFDAKAAALRNATASQSIVVLDRAEVRKTRRSLFGFALPRLPFFGNDSDDKNEAQDAEAVRQIDTTIARAGSFGYGLWTLVLAEGGTWRTTEASRVFAPKSGDKLTIKRGAIGNYVAVFDGRRTIRVERVR